MECNKYLIGNLKEVLVEIRNRIDRIEKNRDDYKKSKSWATLKKEEQKICDIIKKSKK